MTPRLSLETLITLVEKAQNGDRSAYNRIVKQFQDLAVGYAYSILRNFPEAEEAAQEAFIEAYLNLSRLRNHGAFASWFKKIVFKHCDRTIRVKRPSFVSLTQTEELMSSQPNPLSIAEVRELQAKIGRAIELLPKTEREVITLFYLSDRSQKEISAFLEIPISTIKNRLHSARNRLKPEVMNMVEDYLDNQRPSQDDTFASRITQIIEAACSGNEKTIQILLKQDISLANIKDDCIHSTPLHYAAHRGYLDIVKLLLDAGANVNALEGNYSKTTPLHWAATGGHLEVTKLLVENDANINAKDNWYNLTPLGWTTIFQICPPNCVMGDCHQEIREYLISKGAQLDIFSAISLKNQDLVSSLIESNPEVLTQRLGFAMDEFQPLHFAIANNRTEIVEFLLEKGADVNALTRFGVTPLCMATKAEHQQIIDLLMANNAQIDLSTLIIAEQWEQAQALLDTQPTIISQKPLLLHYTIQKGLTTAASWLLERGADINLRIKDKLGDFVANLTPLHAAIKTEQIEIAKILLEAGADVNAKSIGELELTTLQGAAAKGNLDLIRLLVKYQADLNAKDNIHNYTPLDWAKEFGQPAAVELLQQLETEKL
ncbi:Ankyrin [Hyella patelloides LEGE 07179]|uniref:Ankyrin n=1 Tax=Hyella patelloides LEGE 07179 TaxID=945734 RepID=A0A563VPM0_9CYAN|nr:sigma-70 family RNA polymerase sigma factor [Hyella patelloides]VEP13406.1 Ankyrin [Hyella patelloides LEGE 07179]